MNQFLKNSYEFLISCICTAHHELLYLITTGMRMKVLHIETIISSVMQAAHRFKHAKKISKSKVQWFLLEKGSLKANCEKIVHVLISEKHEHHENIFFVTLCTQFWYNVKFRFQKLPVGAHD